MFRLWQDFNCDMWSEANGFCHATVIILIRLKPLVDISWNPWTLNIRDNQLFHCYYRHGVRTSLPIKKLKNSLSRCITATCLCLRETDRIKHQDTFPPCLFVKLLSLVYTFFVIICHSLLFNLFEINSCLK